MTITTTNRLPRIVQNTTDIPNSKIREIIQFVKTEHKKMHLDMNVRVIYEPQCDKEYFDDGITGSCLPEMTWRFNGIMWYEKAMMTIVVYNEIIFPSYSNFTVLRDLDPKIQRKLPKWAMRIFKRARLTIGHSVFVYLSLDEYLVRVIAHELRHHWQNVTHFTKPITETMRKSTIEKIKLKMEKDADMYAVRKVREWRNLHHPKDAYPITFAQ